MTIEQTIEIPANGWVHLDLPPELAGTSGKVVITAPVVPVENIGVEMITAEQLKTLFEGERLKIRAADLKRPLDLREAQQEIAWTTGKSHAGKSFEKYAGCLENTAIFEGDSVAIQKEMRSEWQ
jgi:hypothetical protein